MKVLTSAVAAAALLTLSACGEREAESEGVAAEEGAEDGEEDEGGE